MCSQITVGHGSGYGVYNRMAQHIAVRMSIESDLRRNIYATQN